MIDVKLRKIRHQPTNLPQQRTASICSTQARINTKPARRLGNYVLKDTQTRKMRSQHKKTCHQSSPVRRRRGNMVTAAAAALLPILFIPPGCVSVSAYSLLRPGGILSRVLLPHPHHRRGEAVHRPRQHNAQRFLGSSTSSSGDDGGETEDRWEEAKAFPADPLSSSSASSSTSLSTTSSPSTSTKGFIPPVHFKEPDEFSFIKSTLLTNFMFQSLPGKVH